MSCVLRKGIGFAFLKMSSADFVKLTSMYTNNATITKRTAVEQLSDHLKFACYVSKSWLATSYQNNSSDSHLKRVWFKKECNFAKGENCLVQLSLNHLLLTLHVLKGDFEKWYYFCNVSSTILSIFFPNPTLTFVYYKRRHLKMFEWFSYSEK